MEGPLVVAAAIIWCGVAFWIASDRGWLEPFSPIVDFLDRAFRDIWYGLTRALLPRHRSVPAAAAMVNPAVGGVNAELFGARLVANMALTTGVGCAHPEPVPVKAGGEIVRWLCPDCDLALPAEWRSTVGSTEVARQAERKEMTARRALDGPFTPATADQYVAWLRGHLAAGGAPTHSYDYEFNRGRDWFVAQGDFHTEARYGAESVQVMVPAWCKHLGGDLGHSSLYFMDGFRVAADMGSVVPTYCDTVVL